MDEQKQEIVVESINMINKAIREIGDARERLDECGIHLCSHLLFGSNFNQYEVQVYTGIKKLAECFGAEAYHPARDYDNPQRKLGVEINGVWYFQLGKNMGYEFD